LETQQQILNRKVDYKERAEKFKNINKNYLEKEYQVTSNNSWTKIMDLNEKGKDAYAGLFEENCFTE